jgi:16S rRNA (cytidine1402-2'-O)-methyltransferase
MPGTLYVVATPIGNLEDVTLRALRLLREVALIAAEDTRRTARLLQHYSISTPATSLHQHNERQKTAALLERLRSGDSVALVSDAGTPTLSDPGAELVRAARASGIRVEPVPGPSAAVAAVSVSGWAGAFTFAGFPPARSNTRKAWLRELQSEPRPVVIYEAPHRVLSSLRDMLEVLGDRRLMVFRELTKAHEESVECTINEALDRFREPRGEFTLLVYPPVQTADIGQTTESSPSHDDLRSEYNALQHDRGLSPRQAAREVARKFGLRTSDVYRQLHQDT